MAVARRRGPSSPAGLSMRAFFQALNASFGTLSVPNEAFSGGRVRLDGWCSSQIVAHRPGIPLDWELVTNRSPAECPLPRAAFRLVPAPEEFVSA
ncbi:hypothetical protein GCM10027436_11710 [Actinophytocola sediminis]